jgi:hypothetical protein
MAMPRRLFTYLAARLKVDDVLLLLQVTLTASAVSALSLNQASASELPDYQWSVVNPASPGSR